MAQKSIASPSQKDLKSERKPTKANSRDMVKPREEDPNAKEAVDNAGHGGKLFRDTTLGMLIRFVSRNRMLQYPEEEDPEWFKKRYSEEAQDKQARDNESEDTANDADSEKGSDKNLVKFEDNDPENPLNWSFGKKCFTTAMLCVLTFSIYAGSAIYSPGVTSVSESLHVGQAVAVLGLSAFVAGYGLGPMLFSPMSEIPAIGRNPVYIGTLLVFVALQAPTARVNSIGAVIPLRFLAGFFGSPALATGGASIADMYTPKYRAHGIAIW